MIIQCTAILSATQIQPAAVQLKLLYPALTFDSPEPKIVTEVHEQHCHQTAHFHPQSSLTEEPPCHHASQLPF